MVSLSWPEVTGEKPTGIKIGKKTKMVLVF